MKKRNWRTIAAAQFLAKCGTVTIEKGIEHSVAVLRTEALRAGHGKGISGAPYDPTPLAFWLGASDVRAADLGFDGHVIQDGDRILVEYDVGIASRRRRRFTIAHEVGHLMLWKASGGIKKVAARRSTGKSEVEELCNKLAAEILAPKAEVLSFWKSSPARLGTGTKSDFVIEMTQRFDISVNFAALRFKEVCVQRGGVGLINIADRRYEWVHRIRGKEWLLTALLRVLPRRGDSGRDSYSVDIAAGIGAIPFEWKSLSNNRFLIVTSA